MKTPVFSDLVLERSGSARASVWECVVLSGVRVGYLSLGEVTLTITDYRVLALVEYCRKLPHLVISLPHHSLVSYGFCSSCVALILFRAHDIIKIDLCFSEINHTIEMLKF